MSTYYALIVLSYEQKLTYAMRNEPKKNIFDCLGASAYGKKKITHTYTD